MLISFAEKLFGSKRSAPTQPKLISITYKVDDSELKSALETIRELEYVSKKLNIDIYKKQSDYRTIDELIRVIENTIESGFTLNYNGCQGWSIVAGDFKESNARTMRIAIESLLKNMIEKGQSKC